MRDTDRTLVERLRRGDARAYELVIDELHKPVYRFLLRLVGNQRDAEDLTQETFLALWRGVSDYQARSKFSTWVFGIAYRQYLRHRDKRAIETVELMESDGSDMHDVSDEVAQSEERERVRDAVYALPDLYREAVCLTHMDGLSYRETAEALGVPIGTVKSRMNVAFQILREMLGGHSQTT